MAKIVIEFGGGTIKRKITYATIALCVIFSTLSFTAAAEIQNTNINQSITQNTPVSNAITDQGLRIGSNGNYVVKLQKWLKNQGYYTGDIDGSFGPYTEEAVKFFQNDSNIIVDGWVANQTIGAIEDLTGTNIFAEISESSSSSTDSSKIKSTSTASKIAKKRIKSSTIDNNKISMSTTKSSTTAAKTSASKKTNTSSHSILSQILASGAKYGYSHSASTAAAMESIGSGDCWAMSDYLYSKLSAAGIHSRIVQYSTAYSSNHRSVQLYENGVWVDIPYSSYGYNMLFYATSSKSGMIVLASS